MKYNKIVPFTLFNSFVLLIFASFLASCQKNHFSQTGLLTKWETNSRSIASVRPKELKKFESFQDPKQIVIFCELNSSKVKSCYKDQFNKVLSKYSKKYPQTKSSSITLIKDSLSYENVRGSFEQIIKQINNKTNKRLSELVMARKVFCEKNSEYYLEKCLTQYIEKDTFSVLNQFHGKNKMNGHEYLYMKTIIKKQINKKLLEAKSKIESKTSTI